MMSNMKYANNSTFRQLTQINWRAREVRKKQLKPFNEQIGLSLLKSNFSAVSKTRLVSSTKQRA